LTKEALAGSYRDRICEMARVAAGWANGPGCYLPEGYRLNEQV